jgi:hypothetical protein
MEGKDADCQATDRSGKNTDQGENENILNQFGFAVFAHGSFGSLISRRMDQPPVITRNIAGAGLPVK